jgi:acyl-CoA thioesterase
MEKRAFRWLNYRHPDRFGKWLGYQIKKIDRRRHRAELVLKLTERHLSVAGRVHGGVISGFFDAACGAAVFATMGQNDFASTVELKVNYFRPLEKGDLLKCVAQVIFEGKRLRSVTAFIYRNSEKKPVAMASGTFYVVEGEKTSTSSRTRRR